MASRTGDFGYTPTPVVTDAPQIGGAISPVRVDPRDMDNLGQAMVSVGQGAQAYGDAGVKRIQQTIDLNYAAKIGLEQRSALAGLHVETTQGLSGDKTPEQVWQEFSDKAEKIRASIGKGAANDVQRLAAEKSFDSALASYSGKVETEALRALEKRTALVLDGERANVLANVYTSMSSGSPDWKTQMLTGWDDLSRAIDARAATGAINPLMAEEMKKKYREDYFTEIIRNRMLDDSTFDAMLDEWKKNKPVVESKDKDGNTVASATWKDLAGAKAIPAIEQYSQRLLEIRIRRDAMESEKQFRNEQRFERDLERTAEKEDKRLRGVLHNTDEGKQAAKIIDQQVDPKRDPEANTTLRQQVIDEYVAGGGRRSILGITRDKLNPGRDKAQPPDFRGSANDAAQLDRYAQTLRSQVGKVPQDVLDKRIEWLEKRRAAIGSLGNERRFMVNKPR